MYKRYRVVMLAAQRQQLKDMLATGSLPNTANTHARILLKADCAPGAPAWTDEQISDAFDVSVRSVIRVRDTFVKAGLERAINRKKRSAPRPSRSMDMLKPTLWPWPVPLHHSTPPAGLFVYSPTASLNWSISTAFRAKPCAAF